MLQWIFALLSLLALAFALSACAISVRTKASTRAECASVSARLSQVETSERLTPSRLAELAACNDAIAKADALLVRINQREVMRARRADAAPVSSLTDKDALRRRAGLVAGKPAPHS